MGTIRLWQVSVCFVIALTFLPSSVAQVADCSLHCWNPVQLNYAILGGTKQVGVDDDEYCKELCLNNGTCIGIDWYQGCWFQMTAAVPYKRQDVDHWSLANCSGECASYCWNTVQVGVIVEDGTYQPNVTDENRCKVLCSNTPTCTGINYYDKRCFLLYTPLRNKSIVHHWDIKRNLPTNCYASPTVSILSSTVESLRSSTESLEGMQSSTTSLECKTTESPNNLISAVIALATLLGLCILIIIGLVINTIRIEVQSHKKEVIQSVQLENNHEGMRRVETEDGTYINNVPIISEEYYYPWHDGLGDDQIGCG